MIARVYGLRVVLPDARDPAAQPPQPPDDPPPVIDPAHEALRARQTSANLVWQYAELVGKRCDGGGPAAPGTLVAIPLFDGGRRSLRVYRLDGSGRYAAVVSALRRWGRRDHHRGAAAGAAAHREIPRDTLGVDDRTDLASVFTDAFGHHGAILRELRAFAEIRDRYALAIATRRADERTRRLAASRRSDAHRAAAREAYLAVAVELARVRMRSAMKVAREAWDTALHAHWRLKKNVEAVLTIEEWTSRLETWVNSANAKAIAGGGTGSWTEWFQNSFTRLFDKSYQAKDPASSKTVQFNASAHLRNLAEDIDLEGDAAGVMAILNTEKTAGVTPPTDTERKSVAYVVKWNALVYAAMTNSFHEEAAALGAAHDASWALRRAKRSMLVAAEPVAEQRVHEYTRSTHAALELEHTLQKVHELVKKAHQSSAMASAEARRMLHVCKTHRDTVKKRLSDAGTGRFNAFLRAVVPFSKGGISASSELDVLRSVAWTPLPQIRTKSTLAGLSETEVSDGIDDMRDEALKAQKKASSEDTAVLDEASGGTTLMKRLEAAKAAYIEVETAASTVDAAVAAPAIAPEHDLLLLSPGSKTPVPYSMSNLFDVDVSNPMSIAHLNIGDLAMPSTGEAPSLVVGFAQSSVITRESHATRGREVRPYAAHSSFTLSKLAQLTRGGGGVGGGGSAFVPLPHVESFVHVGPIVDACLFWSPTIRVVPRASVLNTANAEVDRTVHVRGSWEKVHGIARLMAGARRNVYRFPRELGREYPPAPAAPPAPPALAGAAPAPVFPPAGPTFYDTLMDVPHVELSARPTWTSVSSSRARVVATDDPVYREVFTYVSGDQHPSTSVVVAYGDKEDAVSASTLVALSGTGGVDEVAMQTDRTAPRRILGERAGNYVARCTGCGGHAPAVPSDVDKAYRGRGLAGDTRVERAVYGVVRGLIYGALNVAVAGGAGLQGEALNYFLSTMAMFAADGVADALQHNERTVGAHKYSHTSGAMASAFFASTADIVNKRKIKRSTYEAAQDTLYKENVSAGSTPDHLQSQERTLKLIGNGGGGGHIGSDDGGEAAKRKTAPEKLYKQKQEAVARGYTAWTSANEACKTAYKTFKRSRLDYTRLQSDANEGVGKVRKAESAYLQADNEYNKILNKYRAMEQEYNNATDLKTKPAFAETDTAKLFKNDTMNPSKILKNNAKAKLDPARVELKRLQDTAKSAEDEFTAAKTALKESQAKVKTAQETWKTSKDALSASKSPDDPQFVQAEIGSRFKVDPRVVQAGTLWLDEMIDEYRDQHDNRARISAAIGRQDRYAIDDADGPFICACGGSGLNGRRGDLVALAWETEDLDGVSRWRMVTGLQLDDMKRVEGNEAYPFASASLGLARWSTLGRTRPRLSLSAHKGVLDFFARYDEMDLQPYYSVVDYPMIMPRTAVGPRRTVTVNVTRNYFPTTDELPLNVVPGLMFESSTDRAFTRISVGHHRGRLVPRDRYRRGALTRRRGNDRADANPQHPVWNVAGQKDGYIVLTEIEGHNIGPGAYHRDCQVDLTFAAIGANIPYCVNVVPVLKCKCTVAGRDRYDDAMRAILIYANTKKQREQCFLARAVYHKMENTDFLRHAVARGWTNWFGRQLRLFNGERLKQKIYTVVMREIVTSVKNEERKLVNEIMEGEMAFIKASNNARYVDIIVRHLVTGLVRYYMREIIGGFFVFTGTAAPMAERYNKITTFFNEKLMGFMTAKPTTTAEQVIETMQLGVETVADFAMLLGVFRLRRAPTDQQSLENIMKNLKSSVSKDVTELSTKARQKTWESAVRKGPRFVGMLLGGFYTGGLWGATLGGGLGGMVGDFAANKLWTQKTLEDKYVKHVQKLQTKRYDTFVEPFIKYAQTKPWDVWDKPGTCMICFKADVEVKDLVDLIHRQQGNCTKALCWRCAAICGQALHRRPWAFRSDDKRPTSDEITTKIDEIDKAMKHEAEWYTKAFRGLMSFLSRKDVKRGLFLYLMYSFVPAYVAGEMAAAAAAVSGRGTVMLIGPTKLNKRQTMSMEAQKFFTSFCLVVQSYPTDTRILNQVPAVQKIVHDFAKTFVALILHEGFDPFLADGVAFEEGAVIVSDAPDDASVGGAAAEPRRRADLSAVLGRRLGAESTQARQKKDAPKAPAAAEASTSTLRKPAVEPRRRADLTAVLGRSFGAESRQARQKKDAPKGAVAAGGVPDVQEQEDVTDMPTPTDERPKEQQESPAQEQAAEGPAEPSEPSVAERDDGRKHNTALLFFRVNMNDMKSRSGQATSFESYFTLEDARLVIVRQNTLDITHVEVWLQINDDKDFRQVNLKVSGEKIPVAADDAVALTKLQEWYAAFQAREAKAAAAEAAAAEAKRAADAARVKEHANRMRRRAVQMRAAAATVERQAATEATEAAEEDRRDREARARKRELITIKDFDPIGSEEIELRKGDRLVPLRKEGEWSKGKNLRTGETGWFPTSYALDRTQAAAAEAERATDVARAAEAAKRVTTRALMRIGPVPVQNEQPHDYWALRRRERPRHFRPPLVHAATYKIVRERIITDEDRYLIEDLRGVRLGGDAVRDDIGGLDSIIKRIYAKQARHFFFDWMRRAVSASARVLAERIAEVREGDSVRPEGAEKDKVSSIFTTSALRTRDEYSAYQARLLAQVKQTQRLFRHFNLMPIGLDERAALGHAEDAIDAAVRDVGRATFDQVELLAGGQKRAQDRERRRLRSKGVVGRTFVVTRAHLSRPRIKRWRLFRVGSLFPHVIEVRWQKPANDGALPTDAPTPRLRGAAGARVVAAERNARQHRDLHAVFGAPEAYHFDDDRRSFRAQRDRDFLHYCRRNPDTWDDVDHHRDVNETLDVHAAVDGYYQLVGTYRSSCRATEGLQRRGQDDEHGGVIYAPIYRSLEHENAENHPRQIYGADPQRRPQNSSERDVYLYLAPNEDGTGSRWCFSTAAAMAHEKNSGFAFLDAKVHDNHVLFPHDYGDTTASYVTRTTKWQRHVAISIVGIVPPMGQRVPPAHRGTTKWKYPPCAPYAAAAAEAAARRPHVGYATARHTRIGHDMLNRRHRRDDPFAWRLPRLLARRKIKAWMSRLVFKWTSIRYLDEHPDVNARRVWGRGRRARVASIRNAY